MNTSSGVWSRLGVFVVLALALCGGCAVNGDDDTVREMKAIAQVLSQRPLARMDDVWAPVPMPGRAVEGDAALVPVPQVTDVVSDGPRYSVYKAGGAEVFWIRRTSGLAGVAHWYGPFTLGRDGEICGGR